MYQWINLHFESRPTHLNSGMLFWLSWMNFFQEGESKKSDKKSEDEEPLSREKFEEIQEKVMKFFM